MIEHPILESVNNINYDKALRAVNDIKLHKYLERDKNFSKDHDEIQKVIDVFELVIVDLWREPFGRTELKEKRKFHKICNDCFNLLQVMPIPSEPTDKIKHVLKLFAYSYLGEKWEDMKRFLIENKEIVWEVESQKNSDWDFRVLSDIYKAILYLIKKETWKDLSDTGRYITKLRNDQKEYEEKFLGKVKKQYKRAAALELVSYYHLAKAVELLGQYMMKGGSSSQHITDRLQHHFDIAIGHCQNARIFELDLLLRMLKTTFIKMVENSIWNIAGQINSRALKFITLVTENKEKPIYELLYPQRVALLDQHLLDPTSKAIVVNLPTSSGKTIIAEFRILQALNQFKDTDGKIVYVVPTRALVNQITSRLRRDLGPEPLGIRVEKMSGALEIDSFEEDILKLKSFDILVTTPEKLNLLIRHPEKKEFAEKLVLTIIDEAHNISNKTRGLNLEMLIANIQKDCKFSNLLLMSPAIPNYKEVAQWLDPFNPRSISVELDWWQPNDKVVGLYYGEGQRNRITTHFKPLVTHSLTMELENEIRLGESTSKKFSVSEIRRSKSDLTVLVASHLQNTKKILILGYRIKDTWSMAEKLGEILPDITGDSDLELVSRYVTAELGESFPLAKYIKKGIGVHNAGLPDDIKELTEWLMEKGSLKILVATTTISQGINFPVNAVLLSTYSYPGGKMPSTDFWNIIGRAGRVDQRSVGLIGIAVDKKDSEEAKKVAEYVKKQTEDLVSVLKSMVDDAIRLEEKLNLSAHSNEPEWSSFLQYISHMYRQADNLQEFIIDVNINLERTYGFSQLSQENKKKLIVAVEDYGKRLDGHKGLAKLSDITGFMPETIAKTISKVNELHIKSNDWNSSNLFSGDSKVLVQLTGIMLNDIPEIRRELSDIKIRGTEITQEILSNIIVDWVSGKELDKISQEYFGSTNTESLGKCIKIIYSKITNSATWGLAAIQKLPTSGIQEQSDEEQRQFANIASMIFYGVDSDEAILMRRNSMPRSISKKMGKMFKKNNPEYQKKSTNVLEWIKSLDERQWNSVVPVSRHLSGDEYRQVWKRIAGID